MALMLCNYDVVAFGSVRVLSGKHCNRCKCLHPPLANAMQTLQIRWFDKLHGVASDEVKTVLHSFAENPSEANLKEVLQSVTTC